MENQKISLVTGGAGFVGSHLADCSRDLKNKLYSRHNATSCFKFKLDTHLEQLSHNIYVWIAILNKKNAS